MRLISSPQDSPGMEGCGEKRKSEWLKGERQKSSEEVKCRCPSILDPYPNEKNSKTSLSHYCRVCNIQLNSCRQAEIHASGKKHDKRFQYLKYCVETVEACENVLARKEALPQVITEQQPVPPIQYSFVPSSTLGTTTSACPCCPAYYYPSQVGSGYIIPQCYYSYPATLNASILPPIHVPPPSLSPQPQQPQLSQRITSKKKSKNPSHKNSSCEVCHMTFPSQAVLKNHVIGSRDCKKIKLPELIGQLPDSGAEFSQDDGTPGELRCESCQVLVNSSHQLQAHLAGHKHRDRILRNNDGMKNNSQSSSTLTSSSVSENYYPNDIKGTNKRYSHRQRRSSEDHHRKPRTSHHRSIKTSYQRLSRHKSSDQLTPRSRISLLNKSHSKSMTIPSLRQHGGGLESSSGLCNEFSSSNFSSCNESDSSSAFSDKEKKKDHFIRRARSFSSRKNLSSSATSSSTEDNPNDFHDKNLISKLKSTSLKSIYPRNITKKR